MQSILKFFKRFFKKYEIGYEYWIDINDIKIPKYYKNHSINPNKWNRKLDYWLSTGEFESFILLHKDFTLVDGYSSYLIAYKYDLGVVPVYFVD